MKSLSLRNLKTTALMVGFLFLLAACGEDETTAVPIDLNECDGTGPLLFDGEPVAVGDLCGPCSFGEIVCRNTQAVCADPNPTNICGGCADLDARPGQYCAAGGGMAGEWACDGDDALICESHGHNGCGGETELANLPGDSCGSCGFDVYICDGEEATTCDGSVGCPGATEVQATQGTRTDGVRISWRGDTRADAYRIYRDGTQIAEVSRGHLSYVDEDAAHPDAPALSLTASTDRSDGVELNWEVGAPDASTHEYRVRVIYESANSGSSAAATGYRGFEAQRFELSIDGGPWVDQGDSTHYLDEDAPFAQVNSASISATAIDWDRVALEGDVAIDAGATRDYALRLVTLAGEVSDPAEAMGERAPGVLEARWERASESGGDWDLIQGCPFDLQCDEGGCQGSSNCEDDHFPGDRTQNGYRFVVDGPSLDGQFEINATGGVLLLNLAADEFSGPIVAGDEATFSVSVESPDGDAVARQGVEVTLAVSHESDVVGPVPTTVVTDASGVASVTLVFAQQLEDVTIEWSALSDPRVSTDSVVHGPFSVSARQASSTESSLHILPMTGELLADGLDFQQVDVELRTDEGDPVIGASFSFVVDGPGVVGLQCDGQTDSQGMATCTFAVDEPGYRTVRLESPTTLEVDDVGPFYAAAEHYPALTGDVAAVVVIGDYVVFGGDDLSDGATSFSAPDSTLVIDRITGSVVNTIDEDFGEVYAMVVDDGELFVVASNGVGRYLVDENGVTELALAPGTFGTVLMVNDDYVVVSSSGGGQLTLKSRDDLVEIDNTSVLDQGSYISAMSANGEAIVFGQNLSGLLELSNYYFASFTLPGLSRSFYLPTSEVVGDLLTFILHESGDRFVSGDFTEILGEDIQGLARLTDAEEVTLFRADPAAAHVEAGGLWIDGGWIYSAGLWEADRGDGLTTQGRTFDAETGDLGPYDLGNEYAWMSLATSPRLLYLTGAVDASTTQAFEVVLRPGAEAPVVAE